MVTVGRRSELARIAELAGARHEGALLVVGPTGSGKTHLLEAAHEHDPDRTVLLRTNPSEVAWPLSGFSALFSSIDDSRAVEFGGRFVLRSTDPALMFAAASDLLALLRGLDLKPVVVLIDDIDKMDAESRLLLGFMSSRLAGTHIRLVATATSLVEVDSLAGVPLYPLEPLSDDEAAMIALGLADVDEGALQLVVAQSAGNALAICENIRALTPAQRAGQEPLRMPLPPGQAGRAALAALRSELDPTRTIVLERLACAPVSLRGAASEGQPEWADALEELHGMGLVAEHGLYVWIRNPLLRSALIGSVRSRRRRELHERLAIANADSASPLADWHLSWADPVAARDGGLLAGAIALADQGYPLAAAELADRAATDGFDSHLDALVELATVLLGRGELALAARYIRLALTERASPAPDLIRLAETRLWVEFFSSHHVAHLDPDAPLLHSVDDPDGVARVVLSAGAIHAMRGEFAASREAVERAAELLDRSTPVTVALHADVAELLAASLGEPPRTSAPGGSAETVGRPLGDLAIRARGLTLRERYPQARRAFASAAGPVPGVTRAWTDWMTLLSADNELRAGRIGDAAETLREWKASATKPLALAAAGPLLAWLDFADGRYDDADRALSEWTERTRGRASPLSAATTFALLGELSLVNGDPERAMQQLSLADALAAPLENPSLVRHLPELVESLAAIGRFDEARAVTTRFAAEAKTHATRWARFAYARAAAVSTPGEPSLELFERAIASFEPRDSRFELAKLRAAKALRLAGLRADAEHATSEARIEFEGIGARAWARRLDDAAPVMATPVAEAASLELLTEEERTIALLVQQGLRNKEIAAQLFVSVRTVELRLTHIYRKVGARSRSHLVSLLS